MIQKFLPYILVFLGLWYLPELFLFVHGLATDLFNETSVKSVYSLEIKVVKPKGYLPAKYAILGPGERNVRVEVNSAETEFIRSGLTDDNGSVTLEGIPPGHYALRIGPDPGYSPTDVSVAESRGQSVLEDEQRFQSTPSEVTITKDTYIVPVLR
jgi:hypothetical protein